MLKTCTLGCRFSQQSSIESREQITRNKILLIDYKQRGHSGLISLTGIENCNSILDSREDRESSVNLLLNGIVLTFTSRKVSKMFE